MLELLVDPQYLDTNYVYKNVGMVGMLYFSADGKEVDFEYISTQATLTNQSTDESAQDVFYGRKNQFSFTIPDEPELVTTKYGVITDSTWADSSVYPFVIFDENGNCIGAAPYFTGKGNKNSPDSAVNKARLYLADNTWSSGNPTGTVRKATILMRADHTMPNQYYDNTSSIEGLLTVDLNGYTLSAPTNETGNYPLLRVKLNTTGYPTEIVFKNGNINLKHQELFLLYGNVSGKTFKAEFENVNFKVNKTSSTTFFGFAARYGTSTYDIYPELTFTDCVIDISGSNATESIKLFDVGSDTVHTTITVRGGNIITGGKTFTLLGKTSDATKGKLIFSEYEGAYTYLTMPEGTALPSEILSNGTDNVVFAKYATENGNDIYRLTYEYVDTKYGRIPANFTFTDKYPFVVFDENGNCFNASNNIYTAINYAKGYLKYNFYDGTSYSYKGGDARTAVVLMRCDYSIAGTAYYDNVSQIRGTITVDLDGYTLTRSGGDALMRSTMKAWTDTSSGDGLSVFPTELIFKNGSIDLKNGALAKYGASAAGKQLTYRFVDINFTVTGTATNFAATHSGSNGMGLEPKMYFENCVIDITGASTQSILLFNLGDETTFLSVYMKGCEIKAKNTEFTLYGKSNAISTGSFVVNDSNNLYNAITLPTGVSAPKIEGIEFVKVSETAETVTYRIKPSAIEEFNYLPKTSITLDSQLVMNVYIPVSCTQKFTFNGVTYENLASIADRKVTIEGEEYYHFAVALASAEAAKDIKLLATVTSGEATAAATFTFSIPGYAAKVLEKGTDVEKTLAKDVLLYVKAAYNYFTEFNTAEEIARVNALINSIIGDYTAAPVSSGETKTVAPVTSVTLNLDAKPSIRFYVTDTELEFCADGKKLNTVMGTDSNGAYVELDVYAYVLCETITYGEGGSYHISDFVSGSVGTSHEALVKAFVKYTESAADYRESVTGSNN